MAITFPIDTQDHSSRATNGNFSPAYTTGFASVRYTNNDCATYTAANNGGQQFGVYYPGNGTNSAANAIACGWPSGIFGITICFVNFGGFNGSARTHTITGSPDVSITSGHIWQALVFGCPVMFIQVTPGGSDGSASQPTVTGKGFYHAPGGTSRFYEGGTNYGAKNNFNAFTDIQRWIQHIRFFASSRYNIDPEGLVVDGHSSGGALMAMLGFSPNQAGALGTGGQYEMSTVPNALIVEATAVWDWKRNLQSGANFFTSAWFPSDETTAAGTVASDLAHAPGGASASTLYDYQREASLSWLVGGIGPDYAPTTLYCTSQQPLDFNFGEPITQNMAGLTSLFPHDSGNGFIIKGHYTSKITLAITTFTISDDGLGVNTNYADELETLYDVLGSLDDAIASGSIDGFGNAGNATDGFFMNWLRSLKANYARGGAMLKRWDSVIPDGGIRRQSRVESVGRVVMPGNSSRKQARFRCSAGGPDIFVGPTQSSCNRRVAAGSEVIIPGQDRVYARAEAVNASYQIKEEPV